jgi:hypothetical protein
MVKVKVLNFGCNLCGGYGYVALEITGKHGGCGRHTVLKASKAFIYIAAAITVAAYNLKSWIQRCIYSMSRFLKGIRKRFLIY